MPTEPARSTLQLALLAVLHETDADKSVSMSWLTKRVGERASMVLHTLRPLADAGLLRIAMDDTCRLIVLLDTGRALPRLTA